MRPSQVLAGLLAMSSTSVALSGAFDNVYGLADAKMMLYGRQDSNSAQSSGPASTQAQQSSSTPTQSKNNNKATTASGATRITDKPSGNSSSTQFDPRLPAGGISMVTPNAMIQQYYKIGDWVTFAWNYTSLSVTPSAIDILASCTANQATYTIAVNQSAQQTSVIWNTAAQVSGQAQFITDEYMLLIYDAESSVSATPQAGYLAPYSQFQFGMYTPQSYTPWANWQCSQCSGAMSHFEKMTITALLMTCGTTFGSLLYFSYNFGLL